MSTETPLTDADVARLVALADAATPKDGIEDTPTLHTMPKEWHVWVDALRRFQGAANPATVKALAARLDALHAENQRLTEQVRYWMNYGKGQTECGRELLAERDTLHAENADLRKSFDEAMLLAERNAEEWRTARAERDKWYEKHLDGVAFANELRAERDALRDAITTAKAEALREAADAASVNFVFGAVQLKFADWLHDRAERLSEAGERRE